MDSALIWVMRILDAGPESFILLFMLIAMAVRIRALSVSTSLADKEIRDEVKDNRLAAEKAVKELGAESRASLGAQSEIIRSRQDKEIRVLHKAREESDKAHREGLSMLQALFESRIDYIKEKFSLINAIILTHSTVIRIKLGVKTVNESVGKGSDFTPNNSTSLD